MTLALVIPPCPPSLLRHLDPRWKLASLFLAALATNLLRTGPATDAALAVAVGLVALARLPWRWYLARLGSLALVLSLFLLPLPFLLADEGPFWHWGPIHLSARGAAVALVLAGKALAIVSL